MSGVVSSANRETDSSQKSRFVGATPFKDESLELPIIRTIFFLLRSWLSDHGRGLLFSWRALSAKLPLVDVVFSAGVDAGFGAGFDAGFDA